MDAIKLFPTPAETKQLLLTDLSMARSALAEPSENRDEAVHRARRRLKRVRSLLRILRPVPGRDQANRGDAVKSAYRLLSSARDADAMLGAARWLKAHGDENDTVVLSALVERLEAAASAAHATALPVDAIQALLRTAESEIASLTEGFDSEELFLGGLLRSYRRGRNCYRHALDDADAETLHDWRKETKHQLHIGQFIVGRTRATDKSRLKDLDQLAECLGDNNDLVNLAANLRQGLCVGGSEVDILAVEALIIRRRRKLVRHALELGEELYGERTKRFAERLLARK